MEMTSIGFIKDKEGNEYEMKYRINKYEIPLRNLGRTRYYFKAFSKNERPVPSDDSGMWADPKLVGIFDFDMYDDEPYANVEFASVHEKYQNKNIYNSALLFIKDFFKKEGLKGISSEGKHRNPSSDAAWAKVPGAKKIVTPKDEMGYSHVNYTLEHLKPFSMFESEYTVYDNKKGGKFWGDQGAGVLIICKTTGRTLVAFRGEQVNEPHTYGIFGGKMDAGETPEQAAKRELVEESGYTGKYELIPAYVYVSPDQKFKYYNFIGIVEKEFEPEYDWETESSQWLSISELTKLEPKHFGLKKLLDKSMDIIKKYAK